MEFFLPMKIPTKTFQAKKLAVRNGKPVVYTPPELVAIQQKYIFLLSAHKPPEPLTGPIRLSTTWIFKADDRHPAGTYKITKPDTTNLVKAFEDCMTKVGFWKDDQQICLSGIAKFYGNREGVYVVCEQLGVRVR